MRAGPFRIARPSSLARFLLRVRNERVQSLAQFVASLSKCLEPGFVILCDLRGVPYAPMNPPGRAAENRALLVRVIANGDDVVEGLISELLE